MSSFDTGRWRPDEREKIKNALTSGELKSDGGFEVNKDILARMFPTRDLTKIKTNFKSTLKNWLEDQELNGARARKQATTPESSTNLRSRDLKSDDNDDDNDKYNHGDDEVLHDDDDGDNINEEFSSLKIGNVVETESYSLAFEEPWRMTQYRDKYGRKNLEISILVHALSEDLLN